MLETGIGDVAGRTGADDERPVDLDLKPAPKLFMIGEGAPYAVDPCMNIDGFRDAVSIACNGHDMHPP
ncbi:hypothetical protein D3C81_2217470 [compost metagenome]